MTAFDTQAALAARQATLRRAIRLIDTASPADCAGYIAQAGLRITDPSALRDTLSTGLADDADVPARFGAWKAAQRLLAAAGLPC